MKVVRGAPWLWEANIWDGTGEYTEPDVLMLTVTDPVGATVAGFPVPLSGLTLVALGRYEYEWAVPEDAEAGLYNAAWSGSAGALALYGLDSVEVVESAEAPTELVFLSPDDYDGVRNLLGSEAIDLPDATIESYPFAPHAEMWIQARISNWEDQIADPDGAKVFRLATAYLTAALIADGFVQGGTLGHIRPKEDGSRDWVKIAAVLRERFGDWFSIIEANQEYEEPDTTIYDLNMVQLSGPTRKRNYEWGINERDWASYPPVIGTDL